MSDQPLDPDRRGKLEEYRGGGGAPPEGHPRQCQTFVKKRGRRCRHWAITGSNYCARHGGRKGSPQRTIRNAHLPRFYSKTLTSTLSEVVAEALEASPSEQLNVLEELALIRSAALQHVRLHDAVQAALDKETDPAKAGKLRDAALATGQAMSAELREVVKVADTAARIDAMAKDKVSVHSIGHLVNQMVRLMHDVCGTDHLHLAELFEKRVKEEVRLPEAQGKGGTDVTPDVLEMDDTIPSEDED